MERSQIAGLATGDSMNSSLGPNAVAMRIAPMASPGMPTTLRADRLDREAELFLRFASPLVGQPHQPREGQQISPFLASAGGDIWASCPGRFHCRAPNRRTRRPDHFARLHAGRAGGAQARFSLVPRRRIRGRRSRFERRHLSQRGARGSGRCRGRALSSGSRTRPLRRPRGFSRGAELDR